VWREFLERIHGVFTRSMPRPNDDCCVSGRPLWAAASRWLGGDFELCRQDGPFSAFPELRLGLFLEFAGSEAEAGFWEARLRDFS